MTPQPSELSNKMRQRALAWIRSFWLAYPEEYTEAEPIRLGYYGA